MKVIDSIFNLLRKTGKGYTNEQIADRIGVSTHSVRAHICRLRNEGVPIVKKVTYDKRTGKLNHAKYFIPVSQDLVEEVFVPRGRPSREFAVPASA